MTLAPLPAPGVSTWPLPTTFTPWPYQQEAHARAVAHNTVLDIGLGGGKTTISLAAAETRQAARVLVLCPLKVMAVWRDEVDENAARRWVVWSGRVTGARGVLKNPSVERRASAMYAAGRDAERLRRPFMAVVNYESTTQKTMREALLMTPWDMLVCDESHKLAGAGGKTSRFTAQLAARVRARGGRVLLDTGTFMPHSALSVYGQMRTLDSTVLGSSWINFKTRYARYRVLRDVRVCEHCRAAVRPAADACTTCGSREIVSDPIYYTTPYGQRIPDGVRADREDELMARIAPHVFRVSQEQLDAQTGLVETPPQLRVCQLRPATRKVYDSLERDLIALTDEGAITSANAMVNVLRLAQVTSGYGVNADTGAHINLEPEGGMPEKAALLAEELEPLPEREPVVIFARFHHDLDWIRRVCEGQGRVYGEISGRRSDGLDGHVMSGSVDVVGVQPQAGGAGISLTRAALCIFYTSDWSLAHYDQAKRRVLRQGQTRHVNYLHLVAADTVDETLFYALRRRRDVNGAVLDRLLRRDHR